MAFKITPCLLFDTEAEDAARYYTGIFKNSKITNISRYPESGQDIPAQRAGAVLMVSFELNGQSFTALNGGPNCEFNEALSLQVECEDQAEIDYYWEKLSAGGDPEAQQCSWLKDKYGLCWQIMPRFIPAMLCDPDAAKSARVFQVIIQTKKPDIGALQRAYEG